MSHKIVHIIVAILFAVFAVVQYNDPDPLLWILVYGAVCLIATLKIYLRQVNYRPLISTLVVLFILYAATFFPSMMDFMEDPDKGMLFDRMITSKPWIEGTREFFGLIIAIGALIYMRNSRV